MPEPAPVRELDLRPQRPRPWGGLLASLAMATVMSLVFNQVIRQDRHAPDEDVWITAFTIVCGLVVGAVFWSATRQRPRPATLRLDPEGIRWRSSPGPEIRLPFSEIWAAFRAGRGTTERLVFTGRAKGALAVAVSAFSEPGLAGEVLDDVRARIGRLPDGDERLAALATRSAVAARLQTAPKRATVALIALLALIFVAEKATGALDDPLQLLACGASSPFLVRTGDWFRLATANLLHGSFLHLVSNLYALFVFGFSLEPLLGSARLLTFFLLSSLAGAAGSVLVASYDLSVGASTGIFGLFAVQVFVAWRWKDEGLRPWSKGVWWSVALTFALPTILVRNVDNVGHVAGFLAGLALAATMGHGALLQLRDRHRRTFLALAALSSALFLIAAGVVVARLADPAAQLETAARLLRSPTLSPFLTNNAAWEVISQRAATRSQLEDAVTALERAVAREPKSREARDTLATAHFRLGHMREAVDREREALSIADTPVHAAQLARFELALARSEGPLLLGRRPEPLPTARFLADGSAEVDLGDASALHGATLHFVAAGPQGPLEHLELIVGAQESRSAHYAGKLDPPVPPDVPLVLTVVDSRDTTAPLAGSQWRFRPATADPGWQP